MRDDTRNGPKLGDYKTVTVDEGEVLARELLGTETKFYGHETADLMLHVHKHRDDMPDWMIEITRRMILAIAQSNEMMSTLKQMAAMQQMGANVHIIDTSDSGPDFDEDLPAQNAPSSGATN